MAGKNQWADGTLQITGDGVLLTFEGIRATAPKRAASPRMIPFAAIAGVEFVRPRNARFGLGYLRLILAGASPDALVDPVFDLNTVQTARHAHHDEAAAVADRLRGLIAGPQATPHSHLLSLPGLAEVPRHRRLARAASARGTRPDITEAASLMHTTLGGRRAVRHLYEWVRDDETVLLMAQGKYGKEHGIVALTSERLLFFADDAVTQRVEEFPLAAITSASAQAGFASGTLTLQADGSAEVITGIYKSDLIALTEALRRRTGEDAPVPRAPTARRSTVYRRPGSDDPMDVPEMLRRLGELRDSGVLTEAEFAAKKAELLRRL